MTQLYSASWKSHHICSVALVLPKLKLGYVSDFQYSGLGRWGNNACSEKDECAHVKYITNTHTYRLQYSLLPSTGILVLVWSSLIQVYVGAGLPRSLWQVRVTKWPDSTSPWTEQYGAEGLSDRPQGGYMNSLGDFMFSPLNLLDIIMKHMLNQWRSSIFFIRALDWID